MIISPNMDKKVAKQKIISRELAEPKGLIYPKHS